MTCEECRAMRAEEPTQKPPETIPYYTHEKDMARMERANKRTIIALILAIVIAFASNALWLYAWMQYDYTSEAVTIDSGSGIANYIGEDGDIVNGEDYRAEENQNP